jgi:hypothetical protein
VLAADALLLRSRWPPTPAPSNLEACRTRWWCSRRAGWPARRSCAEARRSVLTTPAGEGPANWANLAAGPHAIEPAMREFVQVYMDPSADMDDAP